MYVATFYNIQLSYCKLSYEEWLLDMRIQQSSGRKDRKNRLRMDHLNLEYQVRNSDLTIKAMGITNIFEHWNGPIRVVLLKVQMDWRENV